MHASDPLEVKLWPIGRNRRLQVRVQRQRAAERDAAAQRELASEPNGGSRAGPAGGSETISSEAPGLAPDAGSGGDVARNDEPAATEPQRPELDVTAAIRLAGDDGAYRGPIHAERLDQPSACAHPRGGFEPESGMGQTAPIQDTARVELPVEIEWGPGGRPLARRLPVVRAWR